MKTTHTNTGKRLANMESSGKETRL